LAAIVTAADVTSVANSYPAGGVDAYYYPGSDSNYYYPGSDSFTFDSYQARPTRLPKRDPPKAHPQSDPSCSLVP